MTPNSAVSTLPGELLHLILQVPFQPIYNVKVVDARRNYPDRFPKAFNHYRRDVAYYASLRLVCKSWNDFITPSLYSTLVITLSSEQQLIRDCQVFLYHPGLVKRLVIRGHVGNPFIQCANTLVQYLRASFALCSNLQQLVLLSPHRFLTRLSKTAAQSIFRALPPTTPLRSLTVIFATEGRQRRNIASTHSISTILLGLSPHLIRGLTSLEIDHGDNSRDPLTPTPSQLRNEFLNLERLRVKDSPDFESISILLSRITCSKVNMKRQAVYLLDPHSPHSEAQVGAVPRQGSVPLKALDLSCKSFSVTTTDLIKTISINNHFHLTSLLLDLVLEDDETYKTLPSAILHHCPNLTTFLYIMPCPPEFLDQLAPKLNVLGIKAVSKPEYDIPIEYERYQTQISSVDPLLDLVRNPQKRKSLEKLVVDWDKALTSGRTFWREEHRKQWPYTLKDLSEEEQSAKKKQRKASSVPGVGTLKEACRVAGVVYSERVKI